MKILAITIVCLIVLAAVGFVLRMIYVAIFCDPEHDASKSTRDDVHADKK